MHEREGGDRWWEMEQAVERRGEELKKTRQQGRQAGEEDEGKVRNVERIKTEKKKSREWERKNDIAKQ